MARNEALITPEVLTWARELLDLSPEATAEYVGVKVDALNAWEGGTAYPTVSQAQLLAKKFGIPYVFFFLPEPSQGITLPKAQDYRTPNNMPVLKQTVALKLAILNAMQHREAMLDLCKQNETDIPVFNYAFEAKTARTDDVVAAIQKLLSLPKPQKRGTDNEAFNFFRRKFENAGILVFQTTKVDKGEMRGVSIYNDQFPIIILNRKDAYYARILTLFHELVHLITKTAGICDSEGMTEASPHKIELFCNHIAAQTLVPEDALKSHSSFNQLISNLNDSNVRSVGNFFSVSREVVIGRLLSLGYIDHALYQKKMQQYTEEYYQVQEKKSNGRGPAPSVQAASILGRPYIAAVLSAFSRELITSREAVSYFDGLRLKHFAQLEGWCFA